jgi:hypothetical protein
MTFCLTFILLIISAFFQSPKTAQPNELPPEWFGDWSGTLIIPSAKVRQEVPMELHIHPIKGEQVYQWQIVYGSGDKKNVRNYKLLPQSDKPGTFVLDEVNGILLDCRLMGNVMFSQFKVGDVLLTTREELRDGKLFSEIITSRFSSPRITGDKGKETEVHSYPLQSIQYATLTKQNPAAK